MGKIKAGIYSVNLVNKGGKDNGISLENPWEGYSMQGSRVYWIEGDERDHFVMLTKYKSELVKLLRPIISF